MISGPPLASATMNPQVAVMEGRVFLLGQNGAELREDLTGWVPRPEFDASEEQAPVIVYNDRPETFRAGKCSQRTYTLTNYFPGAQNLQ